MLQRFGGAHELSVDFPTLALDGVFDPDEVDPVSRDEPLLAALVPPPRVN